jgi:Icc-related predicted phosphoesterase
MSNKYKYIRPVSDLHANAFQSKPIHEVAIFFVPPDDRDSETILILAGDISHYRGQLCDFFQIMATRFAAVIYVPGNHEYYGSEMDEWNSTVENTINCLYGVHASLGDVRSKEFFTEDGQPLVRFISSTFWADGGKTMDEHIVVANSMNDFVHIRKGHRKFTVGDMMTLHAQQKKQTDELLSTPWAGKTIVVTHHVPSYSLCHPRFPVEGNGGFASASDDLIVKHKPWLWIHGHTHDTIDTKIDETRIVCNPRGYLREWNTKYNKFPQLFIEI